VSDGPRLLQAATDTGMIKKPAQEEILGEARRARKDPIEVATSKLRIPREVFYRALAVQKRLPFLGAADLIPDPELLARVPARLLQRKDLLPLRNVAGQVLVATADPDDEQGLEALRRVFDLPLTLAVAEPPAIQAAVRRFARGPEGSALAPAAAAAPWDAVAFLDDMIRQAWLRRASDIHLDAQEEGLRIRLRVDGRLQPWGPVLVHDEGNQLMSRVKVLGGVDIAEKREPQDGGFGHKVDGAALDVRLATIPTRFGERATMRLLGVETRELTIERLGFQPDDLRRFQDGLDHPHGLILLTGPTGSGKTTTLYAALRAISKPELNVLTVEDPIEFVIPGITQIAVDRAGKVTFAGALRSLLRHDPDVLMVGEIRDEETAHVSLQAAMTGHLVLSSLHTNRAFSAPSRLVDLGCEPYLLSGALRAVLAQRLVRALCHGCRRPERVTAQELAPLVGLEAAKAHDGAKVHVPAGCPACVGTGYRGRLAVLEALWVDDAMAEAIGRGASGHELAEQCRARGYRTLGEDGLLKVLLGETSLAEALQARV
jgi:type II secretory ATPase GspE/PulE/Tfp pilus assembly ATPase PilB-like protein